jgi:formate/nitrite transporter FocA (FNT family)
LIELTGRDTRIFRVPSQKTCNGNKQFFLEDIFMNYKSPVEIARSACDVAKTKSSWTIPQMLLLGILAGAYIAFGGFLYTVVTQDAARYVGVGISKLLGGAVFSVGLMMVILGGRTVYR